MAYKLTKNEVSWENKRVSYGFSKLSKLLYELVDNDREFQKIYTSNNKYPLNPNKQIILIKMKLIQQSDLFISLIPSFDIVSLWFTILHKQKILFLGMILHKRYAESTLPVIRFNSIGFR